MDPFERLRSVGRRVTDPMESLAETVAARVVEIVIQALDLNEIIRRIDLTAAIDQVDVNDLLNRVDVAELVDRVDVDRLLDQVDVNGLIERMDVDAIVRRVDVDALIDRVDVNGLVDRLDVDALVGQTDLGSVIAKSTSGVASEALDALRSQTVMVDQSVDRTVWRLERRKGPRPRTPHHTPPDGSPLAGVVLASAPNPHTGADPPQDAAPLAEPPLADRPRAAGPPLADPGLAGTGVRQDGVRRELGTAGADLARDPVGSRPSDDRHRRPRGGTAAKARTRRATWTSLHGHYAGAASRLAAWIIDAVTATCAFTLALAAISYAATVITGHTVTYSRASWVVATAYVVWVFVYFAYPWSLSGKSFGMAVLGIRVVAQDGTHAGWRRAVVRTLALPLSFLLCGLGLVGIVVQRENRALHDFIAGTVVVYAWDARAARIRFLARDDVPGS